MGRMGMGVEKREEEFRAVFNALINAIILSTTVFPQAISPVDLRDAQNQQITLKLFTYNHTINQSIILPHPLSSQPFLLSPPPNSQHGLGPIKEYQTTALTS
jgi:hypothetical protein